ncbi:hypothetical protein GJT87_01885 [Enterobacteriaceae endosymbiont of Macroplea mutica]|uniref:NADH-quinone oxidoreductase subunit J n=1 Tax=Enterobacteriaceae endosymbiont of Macroplea mutica TaxID=2675791 RepID=UPI00144940E0|nr:NADH-quinone oxidoreductase subunit J [Enterobacteriaceae endosymbiont of Macroplea mutica]QJC31376.1 hypothetical protein GJT87_01885 [Enterobacteriaceae endosymbiont of Macroplea mutica]
MKIFFYILSMMPILFTIFIIFSMNAINTLLYFLAILFSIAGMLFVLGNFFIGSIEIIIYTGAIAILFIFIIMLCNYKNNIVFEKQTLLTKPYLLCLLLFMAIIFIMSLCIIIFQEYNNKYLVYHINDLTHLGVNLFSKYNIIVELISIVLLSGIVIVNHIGNNLNK